MLHKVDYFSYTFKSENPVSSEGWKPGLHAVLKAGVPKYIVTDEESKLAPKRQGYEVGYNFNNHTFVWCDAEGSFLVEHTGAGCDDLTERGLLMSLIHQHADSCSRIDIATDVHTAVEPLDFVQQRGPSRIKSDGHVNSKSGRSQYVGSKTSSRCCKVYRYDAPHPRAEFLRIEYTYRGKDAHIICNRLKTASILEIAVLSAKRYRWEHECWKTPEIATQAEIKAYRPERRQGKTVAWLYTQVTASVARMSQEGHLDLEDFILNLRRAAETAPPAVL